MSSRGEMLDRIRKALRHPSGRSAQPPPAGGDPPAGGVMPPIAPDELLPKFELELGKVGGLTYRAASLDGLENILRKILESAPAPSVVLSRNPLLNQLRLEARLREWGVSLVSLPGRSRTADIEQILIRGVHGPGEVHAILVEEPCLASAAGRSAPSR